MAFFMLSLTGIPLTGGFIGKWFVFWATLNAGLTVLAVIGVLTSVVSAFYYVRVIVNMYLADGEGDPAAGATSYVNWAAYIAFAGTLLIGIAAVRGYHAERPRLLPRRHRSLNPSHVIFVGARHAVPFCFPLLYPSPLHDGCILCYDLRLSLAHRSLMQHDQRDGHP